MGVLTTPPGSGKKDMYNWIYLRSKPVDIPGYGLAHTYYAGKTHHDNFHNRADSRGAGKFACGMPYLDYSLETGLFYQSGKECAVQVKEEEIHTQESEAIQFLIAFFNGNRVFVGNNTQVVYPVTGIWNSDTPPTDREVKYWYRQNSFDPYKLYVDLF